jgi:hypothetical protein
MTNRSESRAKGPTRDINVLLDFGGGPSFIRQPYFDTRRTVGVFSEVEHTIAEAITLSASLRQDFVHQEQDRLSPAAGVSVAIPKTTLVLFPGRTYRC